MAFTLGIANATSGIAVTRLANAHGGGSRLHGVAQCRLRQLRRTLARPISSPTPAVRQPGILLQPDGLKQMLFGLLTARRATPHRSDNRDEPQKHILKFGAFAIVMAVLTAFPVRDVLEYRGGTYSSYSAVFKDACGWRPGSGASQASAWARSKCVAATGQVGASRVRHRSARRVDHRY